MLTPILAVGVLMPGFRFGVVWDGSEQKRAWARRGFCDPVAMDDRRMDCAARSAKNDLQLRFGDHTANKHTAESLGSKT